MALRRLAAQWAGIGRPDMLKICRPMISTLSAPDVYDHLVEITVLDRTGVRHPVRGLQGQTLAQVLVEHPDLSDGLVAPAPSGRGYLDAHVLVASEYLEKMASPTEVERHDLRELAEGYIVNNSRLASSVKLSPDMQGLTVALGEIGFWQTL